MNDSFVSATPDNTTPEALDAAIAVALDMESSSSTGVIRTRLGQVISTSSSLRQSDMMQLACKTVAVPQLEVSKRILKLVGQS